MGSASSWWADKLGGSRQAFVPQQPPAPMMPPQQGQPMVPQQMPQQAQQMPVPTVENFTALMGMWQGGEATRTERVTCPSCGSNHFFSRAQGAVRGPAPSPQCFDCGYNEIYHQETVSGEGVTMAR